MNTYLREVVKVSPRETKVLHFGVALFLLLVLTGAVSLGLPLAWAAALIYGFGGWIWAVGVTVHDHSRNWKQTLNPRLASWAYLADPLLVIGTAAFILARPSGTVVEVWQWAVALAVAWAVAGVSPWIVRLLDLPRYRRYDALHVFDASGKNAHDYLVTPVLAGAAVTFGGWAVLEGRFNVWFWVGAGCATVWGLCLAKDSVRKWEPNPLNQYPAQINHH